MEQPLVGCLVMTTPDRADMLERCVRSLEAQSYHNVGIAIVDTSAWEPMNFGTMRNRAVEQALRQRPFEVLIHADSDDWHAPDRVDRQIAQLLLGKAPCVGLSSGLFYVRGTGLSWRYKSTVAGYAFGASLCYWARTWKDTPFPDWKLTGADEYWAERVGRRGQDCIPPIMICELHGSNHGTKITEGATEWTRTPSWDGWCAERMKL